MDGGLEVNISFAGPCSLLNPALNVKETCSTQIIFNTRDVEIIKT